jgi:hypothetical protein
VFYYFDDGRFALVEFVAWQRSAFQPLFNDKTRPAERQPDPWTDQSEDLGYPMQALKACQAGGTACVLLMLAVTQSNCGSHRTMVFPSPSNGYRIEVWQTAIDNSWGARFELVSANKHLLLYRLPRESFVSFVHVYWSPDETSAAVVGAAIAPFSFAVATNSGASVPFDSLRPQMAESIARTYHLPLGEDPIAWAGSDDARRAFRGLHPEVRLSYHD